MRKGRHFLLGVGACGTRAALICIFLVSIGSLYAQVPPNPVPLINQPLVPASAAVDAGAFTLTVNGTGFSSSATVNWNGSPRTTTFVSSSQVTAAITIADVAVAGTASVTVVNPTPGGGTSNVAFFQITSPTSSVTLSRTDFGTGVIPAWVTAGDFNGDGKLDLAVSNENSNTVSVLLGNADGTFQTQTTFATGVLPEGITTGDFNGDGKLDLAVANFSSGTVSVLLGNGDGTFQTQAAFATGVQPGGITTADFNGDGKLDLAVVSQSSNTVSVLLGNGDGTFQPRTDFAAGAGAASVTTGDFNGDGKLDLAVANFTSSTVSVLLGNGNGTFQAKVDFSTGTSPHTVIAGDFNGDGKLDLAVTNADSNTVSILLGNGDGTLQPRVDFGTGTAPKLVTTGDFNGDGKLDLALANQTSATVSVLLGNGDGTFQAHADTATGSNTFGITAGDFNQDGRLDLAGTNAGANTVSVLLQILGPVVTLSPTSLDFGSLGIGFTSAGQTVTLTNNGNAALFPSISTSGDFRETDNCFGFVSPQSSCTITVTFTPTAVGTRTGSLTITDNAAGSPRTVSLTGIGVAAPAATLSATSLTFAAQVINTTSAAQPVTLTNIGTAAMTVSSISTTGNFGQTNNCPKPSLEQTLAVGANCTINVTFTPTTIGSIVGSLTITDNAPGSPQSVTLSGRAISAGIIGASATSLNFGTQSVGTTSASMTLTLNNTGTGPLGILSIVITDSVAQSNNIPAQFAQTNNCGTSIAAGASCTVNLTFSPVVLGALTGTLTITHDGAGGQIVINLTGTGGAVPFARGELFLGVGNGKVQRRTSSGRLIQVMDTGVGGETTGMAFDSAGNLYSTAFSARVIKKFDGTGVLLGTFGSGFTGEPESILFDAQGNAYVGAADTNVIRKFDASGNPLAQFTVATESRGTDWIELAADQCTIFYTSEGRSIKRFNVCTNTQLPDFATALPGSFAFALRIRPNGEVLVADTQSVHRLDASGNIIQTYTPTGVPFLFALNLDPDGTSFWTGDISNTQVFKFDIASGNQLLQFTAGTGEVAGLAVKGEITVAVRSPELTLSPTSLTLPDTLVNQTSTAGRVTVTNAGAGPLTISSIAVTAGNFSQTNNCPLATSEQSLAPAASCTISVVFAPTVTGVQSGTLTITSNAPGSPHTVALRATATAGLDVTLSAASLTFGNQVVGTTSPAQTVTLTNSGADVVTISSVVASGDFAQTNTCGTSLNAGAKCTVSVTFTPAATGTRTGTLAFTDNAPDSPQVVLLTGTGTPAAMVMLVPTSLTFADQRVGTTSAAMTVMVTASSSAPLAISSIAASGDFAQTNTCGASLAAGASCAISVTFTPTATGTRTGTLTLTDNAPDSPQVVPLTGNGTAAAPAITLSATSVTLPDTHINQTCHPQTVTMTNSGTEPLTISSLAVTAGEFSATTTCPIAPATLAAGASCTISVVFHPTKLGVQNGTLTITSNAPGSPHTVALVGNGLPPCLLQAVLPSVEVVRGSDQATFTVFHDTKGEAADPIRLACVDTQPGECSLTPEVIEVPQRSTMRVTNLRSVSGSSKAFTVRGDSAGDHHLLFVQVLFSDFSFTAFPEEATVIAGRTASYALSLVPVNGLAGQVTLSCAGAPPGASCTVEPSSVNLSGTPVQVQVKVTTTSRGLAPRLLMPEFPLPTPDSRLPILWSLLALLLATVAAAPDPVGGDRRRSRVRSTAILGATAMLVVAMWAGCGGGGMTPPAAQSGGTPPGSFTVVVTGTFTPSPTTTAQALTGPPLTHDVKLTLKVN